MERNNHTILKSDINAIIYHNKQKINIMLYLQIKRNYISLRTNNSNNSNKVVIHL